MAITFSSDRFNVTEGLASGFYLAGSTAKTLEFVQILVKEYIYVNS